MRTPIVLASVAATLALTASASAQVFGPSGAITIPASGNATPYPSSIAVAGLASGGNLTDVNVTLTGITHTWASDIDVVVVGPTGVAVILFSDIGGSGGFDAASTTVTLDDGAAATMGTGVIAPGTYKPTNTAGPDAFPAPGPGTLTQVGPLLSAFNNTNGNGSWNLFIVDDTGGDFGSVAGGWTLNLTTGGNNCLLALPHPWCISDVNNDNAVNVTDLLAVISGWGQSGPPRPAADIAPGANGDCTVNVTDLLSVISGWGACAAPTGACCPPGGGAGTCTQQTAPNCDTLGGTFSGIGSVCPASCPITPLNDNPGGAFVMNVGVSPAAAVCNVDSNTNATLTTAVPSPACTFGGAANFTRDVWWKYTVPTTPGLFGQILEVNTCNNSTTFNDTVLEIYTGTFPGTLTSVGCLDDGCGSIGLNSSVRTDILSPGVQVYVRLGSWSTGATNQGTYQLCASVENITQDICLGAEILLVGGSDTDNLAAPGATQDAAPTCTPSGGGPSVSAGIGRWYKITSPIEQTLTASTCTSQNGASPNQGIYNGKITVYCGENCGTLVCRQTTDADLGTPQNPRVCAAFQGEKAVWCAQAGRTYWMLIHGDNIPTGENAPYTVVLTGSGAAECGTDTGCGPPPPPANDECTGALPLAVGANAFVNLGATTSTTLPAMACAFGGAANATRDVWYTFVVPAGTSLNISTAGTTAGGGWGQATPDTVLQITRGACASQTLIGCNDDGVAPLLSQLTMPIIPSGTPTGLQVVVGETIRVRIASWAAAVTNQGTGNCQVTVTP